MSWRPRWTPIVDALFRLIPEYLPEAIAFANIAGALVVIAYLTPSHHGIATCISIESVRDTGWDYWRRTVGWIYTSGSLVLFGSIVRERSAVREANRLEAEERKLLAQLRIDELKNER